MSYIGKRQAIITLSEDDWKVITHILEVACRTWDSEWIRWVQVINHAGHLTPTKQVSVKLSEDDWIIIVGLIEATCRKWGDDWIKWADNMGNILDKALEATRPPGRRYNGSCVKGGSLVILAVGLETNYQKETTHGSQARGYPTRGIQSRRV
jgi:hypothetical protein